MDSKTYMQYKSQFEELERQVGARVKGAKERLGELYERLTGMKGFTWNNMRSIHMNAHGELILMYFFSSTPY